MASEQRETILDALKREKIPSAIYYPKPIHVQTAYSYLGYEPCSFSASEKAAETIFSLPMHPYLSTQDQEQIAEVIIKALE
jgi:dTDP-4-amino-4,6-dideoxygalactose transaminase